MKSNCMKSSYTNWVTKKTKVIFLGNSETRLNYTFNQFMCYT